MSTAASTVPSSAIAVYSGGLDSTVMLWMMREKGIEMKGALTVDYGQKHRREIDSARAICQDLGVPHKIADLRKITDLFGHSSLTDANAPVPEGHYEELSMKQTVVPNRNMILISVATAWAINQNAASIAYAAHSGDHAIYPDCREAFAEALDQAVRLCDWNSVQLYRPFVNLSKAEIVAEGARLGAPMEKTWSCYKGGSEHCGKCGTCIERREAFHLARLEDPTRYAADAPSLEKLIQCDWHLSDA